MADSASEADKIRNKRLAKLGSQAPSIVPPTVHGTSGVDAASGAAANPAASDPSASKAHEGSETTAVQIGTVSGTKVPNNSFSQFGLKKANGTGPRINITSSTPRGNTLGTEALSSGKGKSTPATPETLDVWEDKTLSGIFRLSLDPKVEKDAHGHSLYYVSGVRGDLEDNHESVKLSTAVLDQAVIEVASNLGKTSPLDYLLACWKRVSRLFKSLKPIKAGDLKQGIVREARRLCMSYCIWAITMPDMFGREPSSSSQLTSHLLVDQEDDRGVCHEFLTELISRFPEDELAAEAMSVAMEDLSRELAGKSMNDNYKPYVLAFRTLVRYPALVNLIVQSPRFLPPDVTAFTIETDTLLGPFFRISPLQGDVTTNYFSSPKTRDKSYIANSQNALRLTLRAHQADLLDITNHIIRTSKEAREKMLGWFAICMNTNHKRRAYQIDPKTVSTDGFMINVTVCLDQLCEPFMDATFSKIDRIDVEYLRRNPRIDVNDETKLNAVQNISDEYYSHHVEGESNFISEVFFLTLAAHHYGTEATNQQVSQLEKDLKRMEKQLALLVADRPKYTSSSQLAMFENAVKKFNDHIEKGISYKLAVQGVLLDELMQARAMQFMRYVIIWLLRIVSSGQNIPKNIIRIPLADKQPDVWKCLPEYYLDVVVGNFKFIMRNMPQVITATQSDELVMLCITFLQSSEYIKNPGIKSGLVTILYHGIWPVYGRSKGILGDLLNSLPFATEHLLHAILKFYIEVENTGSHTQFYDKFNVRYEIFQIIKCIWSNTIYRERLAQESKVNVDFFVRFVNLLLNDVTFVLDESLSAFVKIHDLQQELTLDSTIDPAQRTEKEEALTEAQNKAKSYMQLTNETVAMLKLFTEALADSFTMPEIVQRLADMLDYNLDAMIGPKSSHLKVENPQEYSFNPRVLLAEIVDVYLNLRGKENFIIAVARDGRSYKPTNFENTTIVLRNKGLKSTEELAAWTALGEKFKKAKEIDSQAEEDLGEIPDEFLGEPLDVYSDGRPHTALKARIEAFKAEKKGKRLAEANLMDTTPG
ncbi:hypothetical protein MMC26_006348 [Xylographa opegraphella]|nr:hypothetical protein [Xylographa opegraphella]